MMKGFFPDIDALPTRKLRVKSPCDECGWWRNCKSPRMDPSGEGKLGILAIAESPGATEDEKGTQLIGDAGQLFRKKLAQVGLDLDRDFYKMNAISCKPPAGVKPTRRRLKLCRGRVFSAIERLRPQFIWLLGGVAVESFFMDRFLYEDFSISRWVRHCCPDSVTNAWVIPMFHPSFVLRSQDPKLHALFERDLRWAKSCLRRKEVPDFHSRLSGKVRVLLDLKSVKELLTRRVNESPTISIDYETTSNSPYGNGKKVLVVGVAVGPNEAYSFPMDCGFWSAMDLYRVREWWANVLKSQVPKIAHGLKFEDRWSRVCFDAAPSNWMWDTKTTQHVLDCRHGVTSLKFQSYVRWGVEGYDSVTRGLIKPGDSSGLNRLEEVSVSNLCEYCGTDALLTYMLQGEQAIQLKGLSRRKNGGTLSDANQFFFDGVLAFCEAESEGIAVDKPYFDEVKHELTDRVSTVEKALNKDPAVVEFREAVGRDVDFDSDEDLRKLLFGVMKLRPVKLTPKKQLEAIDEEVLTQLKVPLTESLLRRRKLLKVRDTYLEQYTRESHDGRIYPSFDLHIARSYRSSSSRPNFQNVPYRDEEARRMVRGGIIPSPGNKIGEVDYAAIEVRIAACYTQDPQLIAYICDPSTDMHKDQAKLLFLLPDEEVTPELRFATKNGFVFPEFYGSYYKSCAPGLWESARALSTKSGVPVIRHLKDRKVRSLVDFEGHVRRVEDALWDRFCVFRQWQKEREEFYERVGCVELFMGFRRAEYMKRNEIINTPIQGTAFHCLLWSFIKIREVKAKEGWRTKIPGQIHDSIFFDLYPPEEEHVIRTVTRIMTEDIRKEFSWLIVPLKVDVKLGGVDEPWYAVKES